MPTVAALTGHASAGGFLLALCHDYRIMRADRSMLYMSEVDIALPLLPYFMAMLRAKISSAQALRDVVLRGRRLRAPRPRRWASLTSFAPARPRPLQRCSGSPRSWWQGSGTAPSTPPSGSPCSRTPAGPSGSSRRETRRRPRTSLPSSDEQMRVLQQKFSQWYRTPKPSLRRTAFLGEERKKMKTLIAPPVLLTVIVVALYLII